MANLPEEILDSIFAHLQPVRQPRSELLHRVKFSSSGPVSSVHFSPNDHSNRQTLASVCTASRTFYRMAYPHLYHTLHLEGRSLRPRLLLRSLLRNPRLVAEVRQLRISGPSWNTHTRNSPGRPLNHSSDECSSDDDLALLSYPIVESLPISAANKKRLHKGFTERSEDCELACIVAICTSLEILDLPAFNHLRGSILMFIAKELYGKKPGDPISKELSGRQKSRMDLTQESETSKPLSRVREVSLAKARIRHHIQVYEFAELVYLPSLQTLRTLGVNLTPIEVPRFNTRVRTSSLTILSLNHCMVQTTSLPALLKRCPLLETLSLSNAYFIPQNPTTCFPDIGAAITACAKQLQGLYLRPTNAFMSTQDVHALGPLHDLESLRRLVVPGLMLCGRPKAAVIKLGEYEAWQAGSFLDRLPVNLEQLQITKYGSYPGPSFAHIVLELLGDRRFANLKLISFDRLWWAEDFLRECTWDSKSSTETEVVLERVEEGS